MYGPPRRIRSCDSLLLSRPGVSVVSACATLVSETTNAALVGAARYRFEAGVSLYDDASVRVRRARRSGENQLQAAVLLAALGALPQSGYHRRSCHRSRPIRQTGIHRKTSRHRTGSATAKQCLRSTCRWKSLLHPKCRLHHYAGWSRMPKTKSPHHSLT